MDKSRALKIYLLNIKFDTVNGNSLSAAFFYNTKHLKIY